MHRHRIVSALLLVLFSAAPSMGGVKLNRLFSDHMVLQQGAEVPVWGTADPGERVTVAFGSQTRATTAGDDGKWLVRLSDLKAGGPSVLTVSGKETRTVEDVYVGEVWLCSGQSNMDMSVAREDRYWCGVDNEAEEVAAAHYPLIREFRVKVTMTDEPQTDVEGAWSVCSPTTVGKFSAAAYFFARDLQKKLGVPVGLITSSYGASTAQAWASRGALEADPSLASILDDYDAARRAFAPNEAAREKYRQAFGKWEVAAAKAKAEGKDAPRGPKNPDPGQDQHNPCVLSNGMIAPLVPYAIRGAIWYQGESNGPNAGKYLSLMKAVINNWRRAWGSDFPFLFVQLANYNKPSPEPIGKGQIALVREGQLRTLSIPRTGMAVAIDIGDAANVHPKNKQEVGRRLALAAEAIAYGRSVVHSGPTFETMTIEGNTARLRFGNADGGLEARGGKLTGFIVAGEDGKFAWAEATIDGETVVVSSPTLTSPVTVRHGWADNPLVNLYNKAGLPASPFRTDAPANP